MQRAISAYKKQFYARIEDVQSRASTLAGYFQNTGRADYLGTDLARYTEATPEKVHAAARQYLNLQSFARLDVIPGKKAESPAKPPAAAPPSAVPPAAKAAPAAQPASARRYGRPGCRSR